MGRLILDLLDTRRKEEDKLTLFGKSKVYVSRIYCASQATTELPAKNQPVSNVAGKPSFSTQEQSISYSGGGDLSTARRNGETKSQTTTADACSPFDGR